MIIEASDLNYIDKMKLKEDEETFYIYKEMLKKLLTSYGHKDFDVESLELIPIFWFREVYRALMKMREIFPKIKIIAIKNVNYGIKVHHTSDLTTMNELNKVKLSLALNIDERIIERIREFYKRR
jgi:hypothetical protein